jgi:hypothetical protein
MIGLLFIAFCGVLNRARGGGLWADHLPGHPRFYAAPAMMLAAIPVVGPLDAFYLGVSYLVWSLLPWGNWYDLGRLPPREPRNDFEILVGRLPNDYARFTARNFIGLLPAAVLLSPVFLILAIWQIASYEIGWTVTAKQPITIGEVLTGLGWGLWVVLFL